MPIFLEKTSVVSYENSAAVRDFVWSDSFREWKDEVDNKVPFPSHKTDSFLWSEEPWSLRKQEPKLLRHIFPATGPYYARTRSGSTLIGIMEKVKR